MAQPFLSPHQASKMPRCCFYTAKFTRCTNRSQDASDYCGVHRQKAEALGQRPEDNACHCVRRIDRTDRWCGELRQPGQEVCPYHAGRLEAAAREQERVIERARQIQALVNGLLEADPRPTWEMVTRDLYHRSHLARGDPRYLPDGIAYAAARGFYIQSGARLGVGMQPFTNYWMILWRIQQRHGIELSGILGEINPVPGVVHHNGVWIAEQVAPPPPPPVRPLERLAGDTQNVHREVVVRQTNANVDLLLEASAYEGQDVLRTLTGWWMCFPQRSFEDYWRVMADVKHWYSVRNCKAAGDRLYQRVLDGLTTKILLATDYEGKREDNPEKEELFRELVKRLWEECEESVGMCCEGHIARLANVLVGFDEAFRPPVATGEVLQTKLAAISKLAIAAEEKRSQAAAVMQELGIPEDEQVPWLEAFE
jgi:hypothetical protein